MGETVDFWRVTELERNCCLTLRAEMRVPGDASLDFELTPAITAAGEPATRLVQTARFRPRGLLGLAYSGTPSCRSTARCSMASSPASACSRLRPAR